MFIPRQETETLVDVALELLKVRQKPLVLDLCTGTGAIGLTIAREVPTSYVVCTDIDPKALRLARKNAKTLGVEDRVSFYLSDLFEGLPEVSFDVILCNPPYIPSGLIKGLQPEITIYEPQRALDGGPDGLDFYRRILGSARDFLKPEGYLIFELGIDQNAKVCEIAKSMGYNHLRTERDLGGVERVVVLRK
ncbi:MAG: peptide chain release factor N(5)-glutamine methyltransferase [Nitrospirae bacterium]|nr:MAG: peptide chain release factor N(5)-glutamine methyltransferase [Nitrospirota bacterium]